CENDATRAVDKKLALTGAAAVPAINALQTAVRVRGVIPAAHTDLVTTLFEAQGEIGLGAIRLAGLWKVPDAMSKMGEIIDSKQSKPAQRRACVAGLRAAGGGAALNYLSVLTRPEEQIATRADALVAIAQLKLDAGIVKAAEVLPTLTDENALLGIW